MKSIIGRTLAMATICVTMFSFLPKPGGEGFEISLNNKVVIQQYGSDMNNLKSLQLNQVSPDEKLTIRYHHCGKIGRNRVVTIKDEQNKLLKEFHYDDPSTPVGAMSLPVKDIRRLKKGSTATFRLYYSSSELPVGRILATILI